MRANKKFPAKTAYPKNRTIHRPAAKYHTSPLWCMGNSKNFHCKKIFPLSCFCVWFSAIYILSIYPTVSFAISQHKKEHTR